MNHGCRGVRDLNDRVGMFQYQRKRDCTCDQGAHRWADHQPHDGIAVPGFVGYDDFHEVLFAGYLGEKKRARLAAFMPV